jgi:hypothetical protein
MLRTDCIVLSSPCPPRLSLVLHSLPTCLSASIAYIHTMSFHLIALVADIVSSPPSHLRHDLLAHLSTLASSPAISLDSITPPCIDARLLATTSSPSFNGRRGQRTERVLETRRNVGDFAVTGMADECDYSAPEGPSRTRG